MVPFPEGLSEVEKAKKPSRHGNIALGTVQTAPAAVRLGKAETAAPPVPSAPRPRADTAETFAPASVDEDFMPVAEAARRQVKHGYTDAKAIFGGAAERSGFELTEDGTARLVGPKLGTVVAEDDLAYAFDDIEDE